MSPPPGYHGRCLKIDLAARTSQSIDLPVEVLQRFIGGTGLGTTRFRRHRLPLPARSAATTQS
jgi:aldehyde:ferredoxin oxidoreductase